MNWIEWNGYAGWLSHVRLWGERDFHTAKDTLIIPFRVYLIRKKKKNQNEMWFTIMLCCDRNWIRNGKRKRRKRERESEMSSYYIQFHSTFVNGTHTDSKPIRVKTSFLILFLFCFIFFIQFLFSGKRLQFYEFCCFQFSFNSFRRKKKRKIEIYRMWAKQKGRVFKLTGTTIFYTAKGRWMPPFLVFFSFSKQLVIY